MYHRPKDPNKFLLEVLATLQAAKQEGTSVSAACAGFEYVSHHYSLISQAITGRRCAQNNILTHRKISAEVETETHSSLKADGTADDCRMIKFSHKTYTIVANPARIRYLRLSTTLPVLPSSGNSGGSQREARRYTKERKADMLMRFPEISHGVIPSYGMIWILASA